MSSFSCFCCARIYTCVLALILPPLGEACVCVTFGITGILSDCFVLVLLPILQQGAHRHLDGMGQRRPTQAVVKTYLLGAPGLFVRRS